MERRHAHDFQTAFVEATRSKQLTVEHFAVPTFVLRSMPSQGRGSPPLESSFLILESVAPGATPTFNLKLYTFHRRVVLDAPFIRASLQPFFGRRTLAALKGAEAVWGPELFDAVVAEVDEPAAVARVVWEQQALQI